MQKAAPCRLFYFKVKSIAFDQAVGYEKKIHYKPSTILPPFSVNAQVLEKTAHSV